MNRLLSTSCRDFHPSYLRLEPGELKRRAEEALGNLTDCRMCPRACGADRLAGKTGTCKIGRYARVSSFFPHHGEEDPLRGWRGSGTIFFAQCNLRCVFCQNYDISQSGEFPEVGPAALAGMMLELQAMGCHNINFVTPSHVVPQILEALGIAIEGGLHLPLVYNTSAYDSLETLHLLEGVIDIYMPDFKMWDEELAAKYLLARDYPETARAALREMHRQVGDLELDEDGIAMCGVLVRHLVMPGGIAGTPSVAAFLAHDLSSETYVNLMRQYHPQGRVNRERFCEINRRVTQPEFEEAEKAMTAEGLHRFDR
ncbi:MAG: radical SAM protein [Chloroflexi bacterium]|nr:radical SAM protein [Chloroflexota bacterium]